MKLTINPSGFNHDINPAELPPDVWNSGSNVVFNNGFAGHAPGWEEAAPGLLCQPLWLLNVLTAQAFYWIYAGNNVGETAGILAVTDGITHWDITPVGGLAVSQVGDWTGGTLNGIPVMNMPDQAPLFWDLVTTNPAQELPGWPANTTCAALRPFKYHLIAMNITDNSGAFPDVVIWSDAADPGTLPDTWAPAPDNQAGSFSISTGAGALVDGGEMRDMFMIYKTSSSTVMQYIAGQFVFSNRKAFVTSGILARNCWAEMYGQHYVLTDGDFIRHNGQEVESLIDGINRDWLFEQIDSEWFIGAHIVASHSRKQIWINWPTSGHQYCDNSLIFDLVSKTYGILDYTNDISYMARGILDTEVVANDFDNRTDTFNEAVDKYNSSQFNPTTDVLVFTQYATAQMFAMEGFLRDGLPSSVLVQMLSKDMGHPQQVKLVTAVWAHAETDTGIASGALSIRVGTQMGINDPIEWAPAAIQGEANKANMMISGRYLSLELSGHQIAAWRLNSIDIDFELEGFW